MKAGRRIALEVIAYRRSRRLARRDVLEGASPRAARVVAAVRSELRSELAPASVGVLVAEGDSWFDYPWIDVLSELEDVHGFEVESVSPSDVLHTS